MPDDLRKEYLTRLRERYNATNGALADMLGVCASSVLNECKRLAVAPLDKGSRVAPEFYNFLKYGTPGPVNTEEQSEAVKEEKPEEEPESKVTLPDIDKKNMELLYLRNRVQELERENAILEAKMSVVNMIFGNKAV